MRGGFGSGSGSGGAQAPQGYIQSCLQREANGEAAILPSPEELEQLSYKINDTARMLIQASLESFKECRAFEEHAATMSSADGFVADDGDQERKGGGIGVQLSPSQVEDFVKTSA